MKTDDERLEKARKDMQERIETMDALALTVSKGHICEALSLDRNNDDVWKVFWAVNQLRNKIAHTLSIGEIQEKMERLKRTYFDMLTPKQVESLKDQPDEYIALSACSICAGFIANITEDAKARAKIIAEHWKPR